MGGCRDVECCARECEANGHSTSGPCFTSCKSRSAGASRAAVMQQCMNPSGLSDGAACTPDYVTTEPSDHDACMAGAMLGADPPAAPPSEGDAPARVQPDSFFWDMGGAGGPQVARGFSWYTRMFSLFKETHPLTMQMGLGGNWMAAEGLHYDVCPCKGTACCTNGKCSCCGWLFESFEGGPGYWENELPTTVPKWRVGDSVGCYSYYTGSPLFQFGDWKGHDCEHMGFAQISNQMVLQPDGVTFEGEGGMLGVAYVHTPIGKVNDSDTRNFWTVVMDTENFAGPVGYFLPEFWALRPRGDEARTQHLGDYSNCPALSQGAAGAFEWNTMHALKASNGEYKLPKMGVPYKGGRTTLMMGHASWEDSDIAAPIEAALKSGKLDPSTIMAEGKKRPCERAQTDAPYKVEGDLTMSVGTLYTTVEEGECVWSVRLHNNSCPLDGECHLPQYISNFTSGLRPIPESSAPPELVAAQFGNKSVNANYDQLSRFSTSPCLSSPGPADDTLYCAQTLSGGPSSTWVAWKWYKFVDQPGLQRVNLTATQRDFLQARVTKLHKMTTRTSRWMNAGKAADEGLAVLDKAVIVTPPTGMEYGYVPIAVYEGYNRPDSCTVPSSHPSPPAPPRPTPPPSPTPAPTPWTPDTPHPPIPTPVPGPPPTVCEQWCINAGHCCRGTTSSWSHPSCSMGCFVGSKASSVDECKKVCNGADEKCAWSYAGVSFSNCGECNKDPGGVKDCTASDGVAECLAGCEHAHDS